MTRDTRGLLAVVAILLLATLALIFLGDALAPLAYEPRSEWAPNQQQK